MMDSIVTFINDTCATFKSTLTTLLTINYVIGECVVAVFKYLCQAVIDFAQVILQVLHILGEDFGVFLEEIGEIVLVTLTGLVKGVEHLFHLISAFFHTLYAGADQALHKLGSRLFEGVSLVLDLSDLIGKSIFATCQNVTKGICQIPSTFIWSLKTLHRCLYLLLERIGDIGSSFIHGVLAAPFETLLGLTIFCIFSYLSYRMAGRLINDHQISRRHLTRWTFKALCLVYVFFINVAVGSIRGLARLVEFTLSHLHVPRFHQAGDSDEEEDLIDNPDIVIPHEALDDSDAEENARVETRRRNYDLLIQRRNEKIRRSRSKSKRANDANDQDNEVEALLIQQVEREREDKLCVICQDQEKCIMILPCRHLCICQDCQVHLMQRTDHAHSRTCPICRKNVKQTIKAYL